MSNVKYYKKIGIKINDINDLSLYDWWKLCEDKKIHKLPNELYNEENMIKIIKYVVKRKNKKTKYEILKWFVKSNLKRCKIESYVYKLGGKLSALNKSFPEMNITQSDLKYYNSNKIYDIISNTIQEKGLKNILDGNAKLKETTEIGNLAVSFKKDMNVLLVDFFNKENIKHPVYNRDICIFDFKNKPNNFYKNERNRIEHIKYYCEKCCDVSILDCINDNKKLKEWVYKYFKQKDVNKNIFVYSKYYNTLYDVLVSAYPEIKNNKTLFMWEWNQCNNYTNNMLINMLREYVIYRIEDIKSYENEIPKYLNRSYFDIHYPKFNKILSKRKFKNYYEWACLAFPEYKNKWKPEDFNIICSFDGFIFDSYEEKSVYEFLKKYYVTKDIIPIGRVRNGDYIFKDKNNKIYCPDFVINNITYKNEKIHLKKPLIIEYYGLYEPNNNNKVIKNYVKKTLKKENYYNSNKNIYYLGIYPQDLKNNFDQLIKNIEEKIKNIFKTTNND